MGDRQNQQSFQGTGSSDRIAKLGLDFDHSLGYFCLQLVLPCHPRVVHHAATPINGSLNAVNMLAATWQLLLIAFWICPQVGLATPTLDQPCPRYEDFAKDRTQKQLSKGRHQLPLQRPAKRCRKFHSPILEDTLARLRGKIRDPDLFRLFENTYPNTLDTAVLWTGFAADRNGTGPPYTDEDLAFVITGDM